MDTKKLIPDAYMAKIKTLLLLYIATLVLITLVLGEFNQKERELRNNWAVVIDTSRYFYNYRHASNALSFYRSLKRLGIPDSQILLWLADDVACNSRNPNPGRIINDRTIRLDLYGDEVEVDFRGEDVTVDNFLRLLTGRQAPWMPITKRLLTDENSNIFIFMTGHGGASFLKFQDWEEITSEDLAAAFEQMHSQNRYRRIFFLTDSCQSGTLHQNFRSPNIISMGCSKIGQDSYSHHDDPDVGVSVIDRCTYYSLQFIEKLTPISNETLSDYFSALPSSLLMSDIDVRSTLVEEDDIQNIPLTAFLSSGGQTVSLLCDDNLQNWKAEEFPLDLK